MAEYFLYNGKAALADLRRPDQARLRLPPDVAAAAPPAGSRGLPRRRLLPALAAARARGQAQRRPRRRLADRAAGDRDPGRRRVGLHPDQRDLDHRRPDLPRAEAVLLGRAAGDQRRHLGLPRRRQRPDHARCARSPGRSSSSSPSTATSRRSRSSAPTSTPTPSATLARGERLVKTLNQAERHPMPVEDQVVQIYAATNGYLDRIDVDKVSKFLADLVESVRGNEPELLKKIAGGDWSDDTQSPAREGGRAVRRGLRLRPRRGGPAARGGRRARAPLAATSKPTPTATTRTRIGRRDRATSRRTRGPGGLAEPHGDLAARRSQPHQRGQEHPEDHPRHGDGGRRAAAPRRAADRGAAPVRRRDPADDPPGRRGRRRRPAAADPGRARAGAQRSGLLVVAGDRGLAGAFNSNAVRAGVAAAREHAGEGRERGLLRLRAGARRRRWPSAASSRPRASPASPTGPPTPTRAGSPSA